MQLVLKVDDLIKQVPQDNRLSIDLKGCDYIDSAGLGSLLSLRSAFAQDNQQIILKNCSEKVQQVLKVMNFDNFFEMQTD